MHLSIIDAAAAKYCKVVDAKNSVGDVEVTININKDEVMDLNMKLKGKLMNISTGNVVSNNLLQFSHQVC